MSRITAALIRRKVNARAGYSSMRKEDKRRGPDTRVASSKTGMKSGGERERGPKYSAPRRIFAVRRNSIRLNNARLDSNELFVRKKPAGRKNRRAPGSNFIPSLSFSFCLTENRRGKTTCRAEATWVDHRAWEIRSCTYDCDNVSRFPPTKTATNLEAECDMTTLSVYNSVLSDPKLTFCREIISYKAIKLSRGVYI